MRRRNDMRRAAPSWRWEPDPTKNVVVQDVLAPMIFVYPTPSDKYIHSVGVTVQVGFGSRRIERKILKIFNDAIEKSGQKGLWDCWAIPNEGAVFVVPSEGIGQPGNTLYKSPAHALISRNIIHELKANLPNVFVL
jgi:hypothetical protein